MTRLRMVASAARRSTSSTNLRADALIGVFRICWRVTSPRSAACVSAWRMKFRSTVPSSIRSRIARLGLVNLKPRAVFTSLSGISAKCSTRMPGISLLR